MWLILKSMVATLFLFGAAMAEPILDIGATDTEIRIGNVMPYTGPLAAFASIGRAESAYFDMINELGGIDGRRIRFISYDDSSDPELALTRTRKLVEEDKVLLMFGSFGTPSNLVVRPYLNENKIPQLFLASGDDEWSKQRPFRGRWAGSRRFAPRVAFTPTTSKLIILHERSLCSGRTTSSDETCSEDCRKVSVTRPG